MKGLFNTAAAPVFVLCAFLFFLWFVVCALVEYFCGLWFVVCSLCFVVCSLWFVVCGLWFVVCGLWFVVCALGHELLGFRLRL